RLVPRPGLQAEGGSHCSPESTTPLPQVGRWQFELHQGVAFGGMNGGSHCSPRLTWLLPHVVMWQMLSHGTPAGLFGAGGSHPSAGSRMPLPQNCVLHCALHV